MATASAESGTWGDGRWWPWALMVPRSMGEAGNWLMHVPFASVLVRVMRPGVLVELGTEYGDSYLAMCQAVSEAGLGTRCFAVDTWQGDAHTGAYGDAVYGHVVQGNAPYVGFSTLLRMTFDAAREQFADGTVDLLHIDGLHTEEAVRHDVQSWLPKLSPRGVVMFHDTAERGRDFGVYRVWGEIRDSGRWPWCEFTFGHGLGVVAVGEQADAEVVSLLKWVETAPGVKQAFERLGAGLSAMHAAGVLSRKVAAAAELLSQWRQLAGFQMPMVGGQTPREVGDRLVHGVHQLASADLQLRRAVAATRPRGLSG
ncbi:MAG: class I SAM-dependent methyltransferase [Tepidisphaerales bacterium]